MPHLGHLQNPLLKLSDVNLVHFLVELLICNELSSLTNLLVVIRGTLFFVEVSFADLQRPALTFI